MALFHYNFDKAGPGVPENAPRKKGLARLWELLSRDFTGFYLAGLLYEKIAVAYDLHESGQHGTAELLSIILFTFIIMFCTQPFISGIIWHIKVYHYVILRNLDIMKF